MLSVHERMMKSVKLMLLASTLVSPFTVIAQQEVASIKDEIVVKKPKEAMNHDHLPIEVPDDAPRPALSIDLVPDTMNGYNLYLLTERYSLTPTPKSLMSMEEMMTASLDQETGFVDGHAHLYVNGEKIQRIYGNAIHMPETLFRQGVNAITVTINNHGHMYWTIDEKKVVATVFFKNNDELEITHRFESFPVKP